MKKELKKLFIEGEKTKMRIKIKKSVIWKNAKTQLQ